MLIGEKEEGQYQALVKELCKENKVKLGVQLLDFCLHHLQRIGIVWGETLKFNNVILTCGLSISFPGKPRSQSC